MQNCGPFCFCASSFGYHRSMSGVEHDDFAARYAAMSDGELLRIARRSWELSDEAWDALDDELERRHLELPEPELAPEMVRPEHRTLVLLRRFRDIPEAMLARGKLESAGVDAVLADDNTVRMDWLWSNLLGGVKILVDPEDFARASEILNEPIPSDLEFDAAGVYRQPRCPKCQSLDINFEELDPVAYASLFIFPLPLQRDGWICHACNHAWQDDAT
jgi:Putative prokaryotic signal transducing protein